VDSRSDIAVLRELARQYLEIATKPVQEQRRKLWRDHNSLRPTPVPIMVTLNGWAQNAFTEPALVCQDPFYRHYEHDLRLQLFQHSLGDDTLQEPWLTVNAVHPRGWDNPWGVDETHSGINEAGGSWKFVPPIVDWTDTSKLSPPPHQIDEQATAANAARLGEAIGDILPINVERGPYCQGFFSDIAQHLARLRGLEQLMIDMYDNPKELHALLAFMRDGILANQRAAEAAGDVCATSQYTQCHAYADSTVPPKPNRPGLQRRQLWNYMAAQEYELISPAMHDEFLLQYQLPILKEWGLSAYGCCENLTEKIGLLRKIPNLRVIAVTLRADVRRCAEQIGRDYCLSWRPNPGEQVCLQFDEPYIRRSLRAGLEACRGGRVHILLKNVQTLQGENDRLHRWVRIARKVAEEVNPAG